MENSGLSTTAEIVRRLFIFFPVGTHLEEQQGYIRALADFDPRDLAEACEQLIQTQKSRRCPAVAEIRERAGRVAMERRKAHEEQARRRAQASAAPPTEDERKALRVIRELRRKEFSRTGRMLDAQTIREALIEAGLVGEADRWRG